MAMDVDKPRHLEILRRYLRERDGGTQEKGERKNEWDGEAMRKRERAGQ